MGSDRFGGGAAVPNEHQNRRQATLAGTLVAIADTLVSDFDVNYLGDRVTSACVDVLGAATAGLMLADHHGNLQLVASSTHAMRQLEMGEVTHGESPGPDS